MGCQMVKRLKKYWDRLQNLPLGKKIFSFIISYIIPYTSTIKPYIKEAKPGFAKVILFEKRIIKNHLNSVHAIALANLGELCSGIALHFSLQDHARAILKELKISYIKKARGNITAISNLDVVLLQTKGEIVIPAILYDEQNNQVATLYATWQYEQ